MEKFPFRLESVGDNLGDDWLSSDIWSISLIRVSNFMVSGMAVIENLKPNDGYRVVFRNLTRECYEFELSIIEQVKLTSMVRWVASVWVPKGGTISMLPKV